MRLFQTPPDQEGNNETNTQQAQELNVYSPFFTLFIVKKNVDYYC